MARAGPAYAGPYLIRMASFVGEEHLTTERHYGRLGVDLSVPSFSKPESTEGGRVAGS